MLYAFVVLQTLFTDRMDSLRKDEEGATAVEYGLLVALIAAVIIAVVATLGKQIQTAFTTVSTSI
jgi:pilus assembly protein Flp/PilA